MVVNPQAASFQTGNHRDTNNLTATIAYDDHPSALDGLAQRNSVGGVP